MLVKGDAGARIRTAEIRALPCSDHLKEIIHRCIGERRKRYENAGELIDALRTPPPSLKAGVLRSLKGVHLTFTGILSKRRKGRARGEACRRDRAQRSLRADDRRRARQAQSASSRGPRGGSS
jgi:hypothetical protein